MFIVHTKKNCSYCKKAKALLTELGKDYEEVIYETEAEIEAFKAKGFRTFPQIYENDKHIGGYDALKDYFENDDF